MPYAALTCAVVVAIALVALPVHWHRRARRAAALTEPPPPPRTWLRVAAMALLAVQLPFLALVQLGDLRVGPLTSEQPIAGFVLAPASTALTMAAVALSFLSIPSAQRTEVESAWPLLLLTPVFAIGGCYGVLALGR